MVSNCDFFQLVLRLGAADLKSRASAARQLRSLIARHTKTLCRFNCGLMLSHYLNFGTTHAMKISNYTRYDRLVGSAMLQAIFQADAYQAVDGKVSALNILIEVLEADRASDYDAQCVSSAAVLLGKIAMSVAFKPEFELLVERYLAPAIDWLIDPRYEVRRYAGALIVSQLVSNVPVMVHNRCALLIERLEYTLVDRAHLVREAASLASASLFIVLSRQSQSEDTLPYLLSATRLISRGLLESNVSESLTHASMMMLRVLTQPVFPTELWTHEHGRTAAASWREIFLLEGNVEACWCSAVLGSRGICAKNLITRELAFEIIPHLAQIMSEAPFCRINAAYAILHTLSPGSGDKVGYISLGRLLMTAAPFISSRVEAFHHITTTVVCRLKEANKWPRCQNEIAICLSMLVRASSIGLSMKNKLCQRLGPHAPCMLGAGHSSGVMHTILTVFEILPTLRCILQYHIFDELMATICGLSATTCNYDDEKFLQKQSSANVISIILSMKCSKFGVAHSMLFRLIGCLECVACQQGYCANAAITATSAILGCFEVPDAALRYEAAIACCRLLHGAIHSHAASDLKVQFMFGAIVEHLILVASSDVCSQIRNAVISKIPWDVMTKSAFPYKLACQYSCFVNLTYTERQQKSLITLTLVKLASQDSFRISPFLTKTLLALLLKFTGTPTNLRLSGKFTSSCTVGRNQTPSILALKQARFILAEVGYALAECASALVLATLELFRSSMSRDIAVIVAAMLGDLTTISHYAIPTKCASIGSSIPLMVDLLCSMSLEPTKGSVDDRLAVRALAQVINCTGEVAMPICCRNGEVFAAAQRLLQVVGYKNDSYFLIGSIGAVTPHIFECLQAKAEAGGSFNQSMIQTASTYQDEEFSSDARVSLEIVAGLHRKALGSMPRSSYTSQKVRQPDIHLLRPYIISFVNATFKQFLVLSVKEHTQITSFESVLGVLSAVPDFRKEAYVGLVQICRSFSKNSLALLVALRALLHRLATQMQTDGDSTHTLSDLLLRCITQIIYSAAPTISALACSSNHVARVLARNWCYLMSGRGEIIALVFALSRKLPRSAFSLALSRLLPEMLHGIVSHPLQTLRSIDVLSTQIVSTGQMPDAVAYIRSYFNVSTFYYHPGTQCLTIIAAMRLLNKTTHLPISSETFSTLVMDLTELMNLENISQMQSRVEFINDTILFLEVIVGAFMTYLYRFGNRFVPHILPINSGLTKWIQLFSKALGTCRLMSADFFLMHCTVRTSPATRIYSAAVAISGYCSGTNAILRGLSLPPLSTRLIYILQAEYDKLVLDLAALGVRAVEYAAEVDTPLTIKPPKYQAAPRNLNTDTLTTPNDWKEWMRCVSVELLLRSSLPHLQACAVICEMHQPFAFCLLQTAMLSVHSTENSSQTDRRISGTPGLYNTILDGLDLMMHGKYDLPKDMILLLLNLALFMRAHYSPLPLNFSNPAMRISESLLQEGNQENRIDWPTIDFEGQFYYAHKGNYSNSCNRNDRKSYSIANETSLGTHSGWTKKRMVDLNCRTDIMDYPGALAYAKFLWGHLDVVQESPGKKISRYHCYPKGKMGAAAAAKASWLRMYVLCEIASLGIRAAWALQQWDDMATFVCYWGGFKLTSTDCVCGYPKRRRNCLSCLVAATGNLHDKPHELLLYHAVLALTVDSDDTCSRNGVLDAHTLLQAASFSFLHDPPNNNQLFLLQRIHEMQEVVDFLGTPFVHKEYARLVLCKKWWIRVRWWVHLDALLRSQLLMVRNLAFTPIENITTYMTLVTLCQDKGRWSGCLAMMEQLQPLLHDRSSACCRMLYVASSLNRQWQTAPYAIGLVYQCNRHEGRGLSIECATTHLQICLLIWRAGSCCSAYQCLFALTKALLDTLLEVYSDMKTVLVNCLTTRCAWCIALTRSESCAEHHNSLIESRSLMAFALDIGPCAPEAWLAWALANYELCELSQMTSSESSVLLKGNRSIRSQMQYVVESLGGLFRSIELLAIDQMSRNDAMLLQAMLMIITLWFKHGLQRPVRHAVEYGLARTSVGIWLGVLPQLVAHLDCAKTDARILLAYLLTRIGRIHPQALIYPLTISGKSPDISRRESSIRVLHNLQHAAVSSSQTIALVAEAGLIACELHRAAITWHEAWFQGIENAANFLFGNGDIEVMIFYLTALHSCWQFEISIASHFLTKRDHTARILAFHHTYGCDIEYARCCLLRFVQGRKIVDLNQVWDIYSHLHSLLRYQLSSTGCQTINLSHLAPTLLVVQNLSLAVPGTYQATEDHHRMVRVRNSQHNSVIYISSFCPQVRVIYSKQRPRRVQINGSDGTTYDFLLKGNEDLRQDERVMQLCGLINSFIAKKNGRFESNCSIQRLQKITRYAVMPLSHNSGLIEWISDCCTIQTLIVEYRSRFSVPMDAEQCYAEAVAPDYLQLHCVGKTEAFLCSLARSKGTDLARMLWLSSVDMNKWLATRQRYTVTLGLNSMVGYVIGLGDRHMSNIMINNLNGEIVHIDFGDCFDVALERDTFPEYVPFRLTRQLVNVMEVGGLHGTFTLVCNHAMKVMRDNYLSMTAMLEALVHDPLIGLSSTDGRASTIGKVSIRPLINADSQAACAGQQAALRVIDLIHDKLVGRDILSGQIALVETQVARLIKQARSSGNICKMFFGWCPFW